MKTGNKGEWSELYAFFRLLEKGKIYAADENLNKLKDNYYPIIKILREKKEFHTGKLIRIIYNDKLIEEISPDILKEKADYLYESILRGSIESTFSVPEIENFMEDIHITKIKAQNVDKIDLEMQIHDINTGHQPIAGFSIKSDIGSAPTLLNPGKNTRVKYKVEGLSNEQIKIINAISSKQYLIDRINKIYSFTDKIQFVCVKDRQFNSNLMIIDSLMPQIWGYMLLKFFKEKASDCSILAECLQNNDPLQNGIQDFYKYKIKKLLCSSALGMTPGTPWNGRDKANGGYIIVKKDGDVVCYYLYNRDFFEEYLLCNTKLDKPSASRYEYGFLYKENNNIFIDLNAQIRFK